MENLKIRKTEYQQLRQDDLAIFAENVTAKCANTNYNAVRTLVTTVSQNSTAYRTALTNAATMDVVMVKAKDIAQVNLIKSLNALVDSLQVQPNANELFLMGAGFQLHRKPVKNTAPLPAPKVLRAESTGRKGELKIAIKMDKQVGSVQSSFEFSADNGETWHNGTYSTRMKFLWQNLPSAPELLVRARATGTHNRKSEWSENYATAVL